MQKLIIANWKLNPDGITEAIRLARAEDKKGVVIAPPFPFIYPLSRVLKTAQLGAQDVFWEARGAYTGEVSALALAGLAVRYVIVGHSERRRYFNETDQMINKKIRAALQAGLKVALCVGETKRDLIGRNYDLRKAKLYVTNQLQKSLEGLYKSKIVNSASLVIAYEPVWAIGTGKADKPQDSAQIAKFIKTFLNSKFGIKDAMVLYGGSVNAKNAKGFLIQKEIDGALVGGASLKPKDFLRILKFATR